MPNAPPASAEAPERPALEGGVLTPGAPKADRSARRARVGRAGRPMRARDRAATAGLARAAPERREPGVRDEREAAVHRSMQVACATTAVLKREGAAKAPRAYSIAPTQGAK